MQKKVEQKKWQTFPISNEVIIKHFRAEFTDDEQLIQHYIHAATEDVEAELNMPLYSCTLVFFLPTFEATCFSTKPSYQEAFEVQYLDKMNVLQTLPQSLYRVFFDGSTLKLTFSETLPEHLEGDGAVMLRIKAGYEQAEDVPSNIFQAILMRAAGHYADREDTGRKYVQASENIINKLRYRNA